MLSTPTLDELNYRLLMLHKDGNVKQIQPDMRGAILELLFGKLHPLNAGYQTRQEYDNYVAYILRFGYAFLFGRNEALSGNSVLKMLNDRPEIFEVLIYCEVDGNILRKIFNKSELPKPTVPNNAITLNIPGDEKTIRNRAEEFIKLLALTLHAKLIAASLPTQLILPAERSILERFHDLGVRLVDSPMQADLTVRFQEYIKKRDSLLRILQQVDRVPTKPLYIVSILGILISYKIGRLPRMMKSAVLTVITGLLMLFPFLFIIMKLIAQTTTELDRFERVADQWDSVRHVYQKDRE